MLSQNRHHNIVFTHGDLRPRNIMAKDGNITGIIDWELSGWYPEYWEFAKALYVWQWQNDWFDYLVDALQPYYAEYAFHSFLARTLWWWHWTIDHVALVLCLLPPITRVSTSRRFHSVSELNPGPECWQNFRRGVPPLRPGKPVRCCQYVGSRDWIQQQAGGEGISRLWNVPRPQELTALITRDDHWHRNVVKPISIHTTTVSLFIVWHFHLTTLR